MKKYTFFLCPGWTSVKSIPLTCLVIRFYKTTYNLDTLGLHTIRYVTCSFCQTLLLFLPLAHVNCRNLINVVSHWCITGLSEESNEIRLQFIHP